MLSKTERNLMLSKTERNVIVLLISLYVFPDRLQNKQGNRTDM